MLPSCEKKNSESKRHKILVWSKKSFLKKEEESDGKVSAIHTTPYLVVRPRWSNNCID